MSAAILLIASHVSGSVGDTTYARNQHGLYARARTTPTDPNTGRQQRIRARFAEIVARWQGNLDNAGRALWNDYAHNLGYPNPAGDSKKLTGQQAFIRTNMSRQTLSFGILLVPPVIFSAPAFAVPSANGLAGPGVIVIGFDEGDPWVSDANGAMVVWSGRGNPTSVNFYAGPYRRVTIVRGNPGTPPQSPILRADPYATSMGPHRWIRAYSFLSDGRISQTHRVQWTT